MIPEYSTFFRRRTDGNGSDKLKRYPEGGSNPLFYETIVLICSCKYWNKLAGPDELELLKHRAEVFGKGERYYYMIFSKAGFTEGLKASAVNGR